MIAQTVRVTVDMLLLRRGPQDLPADWSLLGALAVVYFSTAFAQVRTAAETVPALLQALLATVLLAVYVRAVLQMRGLLPRYVQTLSGLFAVGIVMTLLMLGPTAALAPFLESLAQASEPEQVPQPPALVLLAYFVIGVWALVAFGHIYRHALDVSLGVGVLVALGFEFLLFLVFTLLGSALGG